MTRMELGSLWLIVPLREEYSLVFPISQIQFKTLITKYLEKLNPADAAETWIIYAKNLHKLQFPSKKIDALMCIPRNSHLLAESEGLKDRLEYPTTPILKSGTTPPDSDRMPSKNQPCGDRVSNLPKKRQKICPVSHAFHTKSCIKMAQHAKHSKTTDPE